MLCVRLGTVHMTSHTCTARLLSTTLHTNDCARLHGMAPAYPGHGARVRGLCVRALTSAERGHHRMQRACVSASDQVGFLYDRHHRHCLLPVVQLPAAHFIFLWTAQVRVITRSTVTDGETVYGPAIK